MLNQSEHIPAEYEVDNRTVYGILDQICKDTDLYPYVKHQKSKRDSRGAFYAIHSKWPGPNYVNATASKAKMDLQMSMYDGEKKAWNWESMLPDMSSTILSWETLYYGY